MLQQILDVDLQLHPLVVSKVVVYLDLLLVVLNLALVLLLVPRRVLVLAQLVPYLPIFE